MHRLTVRPISVTSRAHCSAFEEGTECSDGQTDPCQFGNSVICSGRKWQRRAKACLRLAAAREAAVARMARWATCAEPERRYLRPGLACCYPCGVEGCDFVCEARCAAGSVGCTNGCLARP